MVIADACESFTQSSHPNRFTDVRYRVMTPSRRFTERVRYALIQRGLIALLLPLGLLFLAFVTHG
jgi:hypothetical protein